MKKTEYVMLISGSVYNATKYRRVYEQDGRFFVKVNGEIRDVTFAKADFVKE